jgi:hypothetical protein
MAACPPRTTEVVLNETTIFVSWPYFICREKMLLFLQDYSLFNDPINIFPRRQQKGTF